MLLTALAIIASWLLGREGKSHLLALPLFASFAVLVTTVHRASREQPVAMLALLAVWAAIYAIGFLRGQLSPGEGKKPSAATLALTGGVGFGFAALAAALLSRHHPIAYGGVLLVLSLGYGLLGAVVEKPIVGAGAILTTFCFMVLDMPHVGR